MIEWILSFPLKNVVEEIVVQRLSTINGKAYIIPKVYEDPQNYTKPYDRKKHKQELTNTSLQ